MKLRAIWGAAAVAVTLLGTTALTMPAFAADYSDAEIAAVSNYVIAHFGGKTGRVSAGDVAKARRQ